MNKLRIVALLLATHSTSAGDCLDGSSPGASGCCADTSTCPPCTAVAVAATSGSGVTCTCSGTTGDTAHLDATCVDSTGCAALISGASHLSMGDCVVCAGAEVCWPSEAAMAACQVFDVAMGNPVMGRDVNGKIECTAATTESGASRAPHAMVLLAAVSVLFLTVSQ